MSRREEVVRASIEVLADRGGRGFTHRAVDAAAGVPLGTTSNFFSSRRDLLFAALERVVEGFDAPDTALLPPEPANEADLVRSLGAAIDALLELRRADVFALCSILFESVTDAKFAEQVIPHTEWWERLHSGYLAKLGAADPDLGGLLITNYLLAVVVKEFADPSPDFDARATVEPLVRGLLH